MKNILTAFFILFVLSLYGQSPEVDSERFRSKNNAEEAAFPVYSSGARLIYNSELAKWRFRVGAGGWQDLITGGGGGIDWSSPVNANIVPDGDNTRNIGTPAAGFAGVYGHFLYPQSTATGDFDWEIAPNVSGSHLVFSAETTAGTQSYTERYRMLQTGAATAARHILAKEDGDALYSPIAQAVPTGGTTAQVLAKNTSSDNDVIWVDQEVPDASVHGDKIDWLVAPTNNGIVQFVAGSPGKLDAKLASDINILKSDPAGRTNGKQIFNLIEQPHTDYESDGPPPANTVIIVSDAPPADELTGTALDLSSLEKQYNMSAASSAATFTTTNAKAGGYAVSLINKAGAAPTVTGATQLPNTAAFVASTNMLLCVKAFGSTVKYWFVEY